MLLQVWDHRQLQPELTETSKKLSTKLGGWILTDCQLSIRSFILKFTGMQRMALLTRNKYFRGRENPFNQSEPGCSARLTIW